MITQATLSRVISSGIVALASLLHVAKANELSIHNETLEARFDLANERFSIVRLSTGRMEISDGRLIDALDRAEVGSTTDPIWGEGRAIDLISKTGNRAHMLLFPKLAFVLFQFTLHNSGTEFLKTVHFPALSMKVDLAVAPGALKCLGTGGLSALDQGQGSYAWMAIAEPKSRKGIVGGWLTFERGSGVVLGKVANNGLRLEAQIDYGNLRLAPDRSETLETFALGSFDDARLGLEAWADAVAKVHHVHLPAQVAGYCTWYSTPHGGSSDQDHLAQQTAFAAQNLAPFGFSVVQIDDGWQAGVSTNGPKHNFSTYATNGPYGRGMKAAADMVKTNGLMPGLWFMPFAGTWYDPFFREHQDWFVKNASGDPYQTPWGGTSLDLTRPAVRAYLQSNVQRIAQDWGFNYFKMDGLWTGTATRQMYVNDVYQDDGIGDAVFSDLDKTNIEAYRDGLKLVRDTAGPKVFILGCCTPQNMRSYGGAFGLVDAMRIGPDNGSGWPDLITGPKYGSRQYFLHGRVWFNDPDPVYVRESVPLSQAQLICSWVSISGQMNLCSEWLPSLPMARLDILKRTMPSHGLLPRPVDLFDHTVPQIWLLTDTRRTPRRDVVALFNWEDEEQTIECAMDRIGLEAQKMYVAFDFWGNQPVELVAGALRLRLPARSCRILAVRPAVSHPQLLSTSRHLTQGIVDVVAEQWHPLTQTLTGSSRLVGHDRYELRIVLPQAAGQWALQKVSLSAADQAAGVQMVNSSAEGALVRIALESPTSRIADWKLNWKKL